MANNNASESLFPLEQQLKSDDQGIQRDALVGSLQQQAAAIKKQMDAGVTQSEFTRLSSVHKALEVAAMVAAVVWRRYHSA
jgi:hypothetical protein